MLPHHRVHARMVASVSPNMTICSRIIRVAKIVWEHGIGATTSGPIISERSKFPTIGSNGSKYSNSGWALTLALVHVFHHLALLFAFFCKHQLALQVSYLLATLRMVIWVVVSCERSVIIVGEAMLVEELIGYCVGSRVAVRLNFVTGEKITIALSKTTDLATMALSSTRSTTSATTSPSPGQIIQPQNQLIITKLTEHNYLKWKQQVLSAVRGYGLEGFLNSETTPPKKFITSPDTQCNVINPEYATFQRQDQLLVSWLLSSLFDSILVLMAKTRIKR
ncbi:hypothetical protein DH2020_006613 [Rehmannia glutinosa]|uniref:Retrotransposon Copia-like N-terminal domain-containing protein n=1 Tax=Rehmannia glutinosa TaxID=99300 RepID=A0ABR0XJD4_REHGL